jgi:gluconokinase
MPHVVVMGVSGCGKTTVGRLLARHLEVPFIEGDERHPPRNVELMAAGIALTDEDRAGWLDAVAAELARRPEGAVASCSALRRRYRDRLRRVVPALRFVHLGGDRAVLEERLEGASNALLKYRSTAASPTPVRAPDPAPAPQP